MKRKSQFLLFWGYVSVWSLNGILIHKAMKSPPDDSETSIPSTQIVLMQEVLKLIFASMVLAWTGKDGFGSVFRSRRLAVAYLAPATLYAAYNNLSVLGLSLFNPSTYFLLLQFRIVIVGVLSVFVLGRRISTQQWFALVVVMVGTMIKEVGGNSLWESTTSSSSTYGYLIIPIQLLLSACAGILNEYLLKRYPGGDAQNFFMYFDSIIVNSIVAFVGVGSSAIVKQMNGDPYVWVPVVITGSTTGIIAGYFLRHLDSIWKAIASAVEMWITAILSYFVMGLYILLSVVLNINPAVCFTY
jgi:hypothetical protein